MIFEYQKNKRFFAQVTGMMEDICEQELIELGANNTEKAYRGVYFEADFETLYKINYTSRLLSRVLAPLVVFYCDNTNVILKTAETINWEELLPLNKTFAISASVSIRFSTILLTINKASEIVTPASNNIPKVLLNWITAPIRVK